MTDYDSRVETRLHISRVRDFLFRATENLWARAEKHDASKLIEPELSHWNVATPRLRELTYGSPEYAQSLADLKPALEHHFALNDHHPEHYENGVRGMSLIALLEMLCDWRAASERTKKRADGDMYLNKSFADSLEFNQRRFGYTDELAEILYNTARELDML